MARPSTTTPASSRRRRSSQAEAIVDAIEAQTKAEVVVYTQALGRDDITTEEAEADAARPDGPSGASGVPASTTAW